MKIQSEHNVGKFDLDFKNLKSIPIEYISKIHNVIFLILDNNGIISFINEFGSKILEYNEGELIGKSWFEKCLPERIKKEKKKIFQKLIRGEVESIVNVGEIIITKTGKEKQIEWNYTPLSNIEGNIIGTMNFGTDITERKKTERKIYDQLKIIESISDAIIITDLNFNVISWNKGAEQIYGWKRSEIIGKSVPQFLKTTLLNETVDVAGKKIFEEGYWKGEAIQERKDGKKIFVLNATTLVKDIDGNPIGTVGVNRDISERKKNQQELEAAEIRYRTIFEQSPDMIIIMDPVTKKPVEFNDKVCELLGYSQKEFLKMKIHEYEVNENQEEVKSHVEQILRDGSADFETKFLTKKGEILDIFARVKVIELSGKTYFQSICQDISESKKADKVLKERELLLQKTQEIGKIGSFEMDLSTNDVVWSDQLYKLFGWKKEGKKIDYEKVLALIHPDDREWAIKVSSEAAKKQKPYTLEHRVIHPDGKIFDLLIKGDVIRNDRNEAVKIGGITQDITDRKKAETKIKEIKERLERLTDNADEAIFRVDAHGGNVTYANPTAERLFGYSMEEWISDPHLGTKIILPDFVERQKEIIEEINKNKKPIKNVVLGWKTKDGREVIMEYTIIPIIDKNGQVVYFESIGRDITERKKSEENLKESERRLKEAQALGKIGYWEFDITSQHITWSEQVFEIYNRNPSLGPPSFEEEAAYYTPEINERLKEYSRRAIEFGEEFDYDLQANLPNGMVVQLTSLMRTIKNESGQVIKLVGIVQDITERKKAEEELKQSELKLRERVKELNCLYEISKLIEKPEISLKQVINGTLNLIPPTWQYPNICNARITYNERKYTTLNFEESEWKLHTKVKINDKDLEIEIFYLENKPFLKEEEFLIEEIGKRLKTIIEQKQAEQKLKTLNQELEQKVEERTIDLIKSEEKFRNIFMESPIGIELYDSEGKLINVNKSCLDIFGVLIEDEVNGFNLFEDLNVPEEEMEKLKSGEIIRYESLFDFEKLKQFKLYKTEKSGIIYVDVLINPLKLEEEKKIKNYLVQVQDITDRKKAEQKLKESEEKVRNIINNISDVLIEIDIQGVLTFISPQIYNISEYSSKELISTFFIDQIHPEDQAFYQESIEKTANSRGSLTFECRMRHKKGYYIPISLRGSFVKNRNMLKLYGVIRDITEKRRVDNMIKKEIKKLKELDRIRNDLVTRMSHELKTPLISIFSGSEFLLNDFTDKLRDDVKEIISDIYDGGVRLKSMVENLITVFEIDSKEIKFNYLKENLITIIKQCIEAIIFQANKRKISINVELLDKLYFNVDKLMFERAIFNILSNAVKNTPPNGNVFISTIEHHNYIEIIIKDTGVGITRKEIVDLFKPFGKIERYGKGMDVDIEGPGLGLYIANEIIKLHGGELILKSKGRNKGCIFTIRLYRKR